MISSVTMSEIHGATSRVTRKNGSLIKVYERSPVQVKDALLRTGSDHRSERYFWRKEGHFLRTLNVVPDQEFRYVPRLLGQSGRHEEPPYVEMETFDGLTYRDMIVDALQKGGDPIDLLCDLPEQIAKLHRQVNRYQKELLSPVDGSRPQKSVIKLRSFEERRTRVWHYFRAIVYSCSPHDEVVRLRQRGSSGEVEPGTLNRDLKFYFRKKGIDPMNLTGDFVRREYELLYGKAKPHTSAKKLLRDGRLQVINGDLGPQHVFDDGRAIDWDEVRLGAGIEDFVSAAFNMFTYPRGGDAKEREFRLMSLGLQYVAEMKGEELTETERRQATYAIVAARLAEMLRIFAADCKASEPELQRLVEGHPIYDGLPIEVLRPKLLEDLFIEGLVPFVDFYRRGEGNRALLSEDSKLRGGRTKLDWQLEAVESALDTTDVFEGFHDTEVLGNFQRLLRGSQ